MVENIRTARQLFPTFVIHFFNQLAMAPLSFSNYYNLTSDPAIFSKISMSFYFYLSIANALMEYTLIRYTVYRIPLFQHRARINITKDHTNKAW